ncbi:MAG: hypothetical protein WC244_01655 [Patescibacteria group bacterium]|jgi:hypothetical protein
MMFKKSLTLGLYLSVVALMIFFVFEGQLVQADNPDQFDVTLTVSGEMTLNCPLTTVAMTPAIPGMTGGTASTTLDCGVVTNNAGGYSLSVHATGAPALISGANSFADATTTPFYDWAGTVATNESKFGFAVSSTDVVTALKNNGAACNTGSSISNSYCFQGFNNTTDIPIVSRASDTGGAIVTTTMRFLAQVGTAKNQDTGSYVATVVVTGSTN